MAISDTSLTRAVEITKAAIVAQNGVWIAHGETVAKFIEAVARKLEDLRNEPERR
jgi:hypothetical protein